MSMSMSMPLRVGIGVDCHRLAVGRRLVLGGVEIPWEKGLVGHSDADVLTHAVCDALLGAAGLGDLGRHFPDDDPAYRGISSLILLERVRGLLIERGYTAVNVDATVIAQEPRLSNHLPRMRERLAAALDLSPERVNLKATAPEGLGDLGRGEGLAAWAVALIAATDDQG